MPQAEPRVTLREQEVELRRVAPGGYRIAGGGYWQVEARHRLSNLTDGRVRLRIGIPEPACPDDLDCPASPFGDMRASLRGEPVSIEVAQAGEGGARVHLLEADLGAHETVELAHSYRFGASEGPNGGEVLAQPARLAALWAGPVGVETWRILLPFRPWGLTLGGWGAMLLAFDERPDAAGSPQVAMRFARSDAEPGADLGLYIGPGRPTLVSPPLLPDCPAPADLFGSALEEKDFDPSRAADLLPALSSETLRICRNALYAHHGYDFTDPKMSAAFYGATGLKVMAPRLGLPGAVFARGSAFVPTLLSPEEQAYVAAIRRLEASR